MFDFYISFGASINFSTKPWLKKESKNKRDSLGPVHLRNHRCCLFCLLSRNPNLLISVAVFSAALAIALSSLDPRLFAHSLHLPAGPPPGAGALLANSLSNSVCFLPRRYFVFLRCGRSGASLLLALDFASLHQRSPSFFATHCALPALLVALLDTATVKGTLDRREWCFWRQFWLRIERARID